MNKTQAIIKRPVGSTDDVLLFDNSFDGSALSLLTISEVAKCLKISSTGVRRLLEQRVIAFVKVGGSVRFMRGDMISYLQKQRVKTIE